MNAPSPVQGLAPSIGLGDPVPWLSAQTIKGGRVDLHVDAGRYIVLCFLGTPSGRPDLVDARLGMLLRHARMFREDHTVCYGILDRAPAEGSRYWRIGRPGLAFLADYDRALARALDAELEPATIVLDPLLRLIARIRFDRPEGWSEQLGEVLRSLPPPAEHAGMRLPAPALIVPRVFEFELCDFLVDAHRRSGGSDSGFMLDLDGQSTTVIDHDLKSRTDCVVRDPVLLRALRDRIARRLLPAIKLAFSFDATRMDRIIVAQYSAQRGDHFFRHRDNVNASAAHRRFALTLNLNAERANYDGGELVFPEFGPDAYRIPTGAAIVFSCGLLHEVTRVTRGERYALLSFFYGEEDARRRVAQLGPDGAAMEPSVDDRILDPAQERSDAAPPDQRADAAGPDRTVE